MAFQPKVVDLDGLRVVLVKDDRQSVTVRALVGTGSREESTKDLGSAHFLEHFVFKGTKKYPKEIGSIIDSYGGALDAYTSHDSVSFMVKMGVERMETAIDLVGEMICKPMLPEKLIKKERKIISEEIKWRDDDPQMRAYEEMWLKLFEGTNLGNPIAGTFETVSGITTSNLRDYMDKWFVPGNVIVGVIGSWKDEKEVLSMVKKSFGKLIKRKSSVPTKNKFVESVQDGPRIKLVYRKGMQQSSVYLGFRSVELGNKYEMPLKLTNILLGGAWFSRLMKEIRETRGWAYSIGSFNDELVDTGAWVIGAGLPKRKIKMAVSLIMEMIDGLGGTGKWGITDKELKLAKECYSGRVSLKYDVPEKALDSALYDLMFEGKIHSAKELKERSEKVTLEEIRGVCRLVFDRNRMAVGIVGDYKEVPVRL